MSKYDVYSSIYKSKIDEALAEHKSQSNESDDFAVQQLDSQMASMRLAVRLGEIGENLLEETATDKEIDQIKLKEIFSYQLKDTVESLI